MKILLAGMHVVPNQFTRGIEEFGCEWVHWHGGKSRETLPTNCDAVLIARCHISHHSFWRAKETYLKMGKPIFVSIQSFSDVSGALNEWLKRTGHLTELGTIKKASPKNTLMAHAFKQAEKPKPIKQEETMLLSTDQKTSFEKTKGQVDPIIKAMHEAGHAWKDISDALNQRGLKTKTGIAWSGPGTNAYALSEGLVARKVSTVAGPAGSTGAASRPSQKPRKVRSKVDDGGVSDQEIEEIMTSNLQTSLKMKVIRLLANARG